MDVIFPGTGPFTVFAPNDDAFDRVPPDVLDDLLADVEELTSNSSFIL